MGEKSGIVFRSKEEMLLKVLKYKDLFFLKIFYNGQRYSLAWWESIGLALQVEHWPSPAKEQKYSKGLCVGEVRLP